MTIPSPQKINKAVITGATGVIGTALIDQLLNKGISLLVFCNPNSTRKDNIPRHPLIQVEYLSLKDIHSFQCADCDFDIFFHLGWEGTNKTDRLNEKIQERNVQYSIDALNLAKKLGCHTFIGAGSQAEFTRSDLELDESSSTNPDTPYGITKLKVNNILKSLANNLNIRYIWTRFFSVYGPNDGKETLISYLINELTAGNSPRVSSATHFWDYLYSSDAALALYLLSLYGKDGETYCVANGERHPLKYYIEIVHNLINPQLPILYGTADNQNTQPRSLIANINKLKSATGFSPQGSFEDGIKRILEEH